MKPLCVVSCPIDTFSGYGARSRDFVKALIKAKGEEVDRILGFEFGADDYLVKPFSLIELSLRVSSLFKTSGDMIDFSISFDLQ